MAHGKIWIGWQITRRWIGTFLPRSVLTRIVQRDYYKWSGKTLHPDDLAESVENWKTYRQWRGGV